MNRDKIIRLAREAGFNPVNFMGGNLELFERFAALVAAAEREACVSIVEEYEIPVGNSAAGEIACEMTYGALKKIRDAIRARGNK